ncbi:MAG: SxtJ family membrane protein [Elusimicrobiota bacterium]
MTKAPEATTRNLRGFGLGAAVILCVFAFFAWRKGGAALPYLLGAAGLFAVFGALLPAALKPLFKVWMKIAGVLAVINTFVLLGVVYYILLAPYAVLLRLMGRDPLELKFDLRAGTYWQDKTAAGDAKTYERQF